MFSNRGQFDCVIIGGGPAGSVLACTLASWGRKVCLLEGQKPRHPFAIQSLGADAVPVLKRNGIMTCAEEHGFPRSGKRFLIWGDGKPEELTLADGESGFRIDRRTFDPDLRNTARSLEVEVYEGVEIETPLPLEGQGELSFLANGKRKTITASTIVLAGGRKLKDFEIPLSLDHAAPELYALCASVRCEKKSRELEVLEAIPEGWFWWFAGRDLEPQFALFTDIPMSQWRDSVGLANDLLARSLQGAFEIDKESVRYVNATPRLASTTSEIILFGDAASTQDPLNGRGLESTIHAAENVAAAINTMIENEEIRSECIAHIQTLERQRYFADLSQALGIYLQEARFSDRPFWSSRHELADVQIESDEDAQLPMKLMVAHDVGRFPVLKRRGRTMERVVGMGLPGGPIQQSTLGIPVTPLLDLVAEGRWTDEVLAMAGKHQDLYVHSKTKLTRALAELCRLGLLCPADE